MWEFKWNYRESILPRKKMIGLAIRNESKERPRKVRIQFGNSILGSIARKFAFAECQFRLIRLFLTRVVTSGYMISARTFADENITVIVALVRTRVTDMTEVGLRVARGKLSLNWLLFREKGSTLTFGHFDRPLPMGHSESFSLNNARSRTWLVPGDT